MPKKSTDITAKYTNKFCKPIFAEWLTGLVLYVGAIVLTLSNFVSLFFGSLIMCLSYLILFNSVHEAGHRHFSLNIKKYRWIDVAIGNVSAFLTQMSYGSFTKMHLEHHKNTNIRGSDPDFLPNLSFRLINRYFVLSYFLRTVLATPLLGAFVEKKLPPYIIKKWEFRKNNGTLMYTDNQVRITHFIVLATIFAGYGKYGFWLIFFPYILNRYILMVVFMWLPHRSEESTRYKNTRNQITPFLNRFSIIKGIDFHLEHHLYPSVPSSHLRKLHFEVLEDLDRNKAVYVGRFTGKPWKRRSH